METIADSNAYHDAGRILVQHQAILTLMQAALSNPSLRAFHWLDLACGRGQIIAQLDRNLGPSARSRIHYSGYDVQREFLQATEKKANALGLASVHAIVGALSDFGRLCRADQKFDLITLTNTVHEVTPLFLAQLLYEATLRLMENGALFLYDMETLPIDELELGAVVWTRTEVGEIVATFIDKLGCHDYEPGVGQWTHSRCDGWNVHIQRQYLSITDADMVSRRDEVISCTDARVRQLLERKYEDAKKMLDSLTRYGPDSSVEEAETLRFLHNFWALSRAKEAMR